MTKQKLTFKVEGGLSRLSEFYAETKEKDPVAYWENPGALLEALSVAPAKEIRLSAGYRKLAEVMDTLDYGLYHDTLAAEGAHNCAGVNPSVFTSLWNTVSGHDTGLQAGRLGDEFNGPIVAVAVSMITVAIAFVNLSGTNERKEDMERPGYRVPAGPRFASKDQVRDMAHHAQVVAEQISWFS
jgi:hypothetical protein